MAGRDAIKVYVNYERFLIYSTAWESPTKESMMSNLGEIMLRNDKHWHFFENAAKGEDQKVINWKIARKHCVTGEQGT